MSNVKVIEGNIFLSKVQTIVNTVNCVGVMGAGIAFEYRLRYPNMFQQNRKLCEEGKFEIGKLWIYKTDNRWILNFPTKKHWRQPSEEKYLRLGLEKFLNTYQERGIASIAFPLLGAQKGGLSPDLSMKIMREYLDSSTIPVEIYLYSPSARDDLYEIFRDKFQKLDNDQIKAFSGIRLQSIEAIRSALTDPTVCQLNQLLAFKGIGEKTLEQAFQFVQEDSEVMQVPLI